MIMMKKAVLTTILVLAITVWSVTARSQPVPTCNSKEVSARCPSLMCADPDYSVDPCCGSCARSNCTFRGCVRFGAFGPTWSPDSCTTCSCVRGKEVCGQESCRAPPPCEVFGYRLVTPPGECCPKCDYGVAKNSCIPIKIKRERLNITMGESTCGIDVDLHQCDKSLVLIPNRGYGICKGTLMNKAAKVDRGRGMGDCAKFRRVVYRDIRKCTVKFEPLLIVEPAIPALPCALCVGCNTTQTN